MQTTIRVDEEVVEMLEMMKEQEHASSYNDVIKKLLEKRQLSMFGADKGKLGKFVRDESDRY